MENRVGAWFQVAGCRDDADGRGCFFDSQAFRETTVPLDWFSARLHMGVRAGVCRSIKRHRQRLKTEFKLASVEQETMSRIDTPYHLMKQSDISTKDHRSRPELAF